MLSDEAPDGALPHSSVAVVGGSIAGCATALAAHRAGAGHVTVYERATGHLAERGVGIAVHNSRYTELESAGYLDAATPWIQLTRRRWYVRDDTCPDPLGRRIGELPFPFRTYNWGPLWHELRRRVPETVEFRAGTAVDGVEDSPGAGPAGAAVHTPSGTDRHDLVIGADGYRSVVREPLCPGVRPRYAGYLAWRGAYPARQLPDADLWSTETCAYVVFPGGHVIVYRIPGAERDKDGGPRINWVLYTAPPPGIDLPTDTPTSLPPGTLHAHLAYVAKKLLPPFWSTLVRHTAPEDLFVQPMYDFTAPRYASGRLLLTGDAATVARPHTGGGAVKALQDATVLERALTSSPRWGAALRAYGTERATAGRTMVDLGHRLGAALVTRTPDWSALDQAGLERWWQRADGAGAFGGAELRQRRG
ncbi:FAD-dependent monooxygenase [Streptomyces sp. NPDC002851]